MSYFVVLDGMHSHVNNKHTLNRLKYVSNITTYNNF